MVSYGYHVSFYSSKRNNHQFASIVLLTTVVQLVCFRYTLDGECWPQHQWLSVFPLHSQDSLVSMLAFILV